MHNTNKSPSPKNHMIQHKTTKVVAKTKQTNKKLILVLNFCELCNN